MTLTTQLILELTALGVMDRDLADGVDPIVVKRKLDWPTGTGLVSGSQANQSYRDTVSIAPSATSTLNLANGSLTDAFGTAVAMARIRLVYIAAGITPIDVSGTNLSVQGGVFVRREGLFLIVAPDATAFPTAAAATIALTNTSAVLTATCDIVVIGATA